MFAFKASPSAIATRIAFNNSRVQDFKCSKTSGGPGLCRGPRITSSFLAFSTDASSIAILIASASSTTPIFFADDPDCFIKDMSHDYMLVSGD